MRPTLILLSIAAKSDRRAVAAILPEPNPSVCGSASSSSSASRQWRRQYPSPYSAYSSSPGATGRVVEALRGAARGP